MDATSGLTPNQVVAARSTPGQDECLALRSAIPPLRPQACQEGLWSLPRACLSMGCLSMGS